MTEDFDCGDRCFKTKTPISAELLREIDAHYSGGLTAWKMRYRPLEIRQKKSIEFLNIAVTQLFESYRLGRSDALNILNAVIGCSNKYPCFQILCPACRSKKQADAAETAVSTFTEFSADDLKFMTLLIRVEKDASQLPGSMKTFRSSLTQGLRNNSKSLRSPTLPFKMMGAFEIDLKNLSTQWDASPKSRDLVKQLGYDPKSKPSQYLLHLHTIVGSLNKERKAVLKRVVEKALGTALLPYQLDIRSLHDNRSKDENLSRLASYMFKARLQFADNIFDDNQMRKQARYHTPYKGRELVDYLNVVNGMQNFKGLKYDFGI